MKGLYVYGSLLMAMCFAIGFVHSPFVAALALISCALAALAEAMHEVARTTSIPIIEAFGPTVAVVSWISTAVTTLITLLVVAGVS